MDDPTRRFSSRVDTYVRYRPSYPPAVIDLLQTDCGLTEDWVVADVGSGPGNLTRLFLDHGNPVYGVEPNLEMRAAGERLLGAHPRFHSVDGAAEATTLAPASVDLVTAGQAFHWFDRVRARIEFARILRPAGWVALIWNERRTTGTPFLEAYERMLVTYGTDYAKVQHQDAADATALDAFFGAGAYRVATFGNQQDFDLTSLRGRLLSSSYAPEPRQPGHEAMLDELDRIFAATQTNGSVAFTYDTKVYYGRLE
jgi:SAM-dependent methyltransferase